MFGWLVGWLLVGHWLVAGRLLVGCWSVVGGLLVGCWLVIGWSLVGCWLVAGLLLAGCWLVTGWLLGWLVGWLVGWLIGAWLVLGWWLWLVVGCCFAWLMFVWSRHNDRCNTQSRRLVGAKSTGSQDSRRPRHPLSPRAFTSVSARGLKKSVLKERLDGEKWLPCKRLIKILFRFQVELVMS